MLMFKKGNSRLNKKIKIALITLLVVGIIIAVVLLLRSLDLLVLNPQGEIAEKQRNIIAFTVLLSAVVVVPVFTLLAVFSWRFRESNTNAPYLPNWDRNVLMESIWWGIPCVIIIVLGIITWQTSHELDPYKPIVSKVKPVNVQVIALQWKWLFIYPDYQVASVNLLPIPEKTPINFTLTSDAPMNSFWVPSLGSQVYAMSGMSTKLHLIANKTGDYYGSSANISGKGFADMVFTARATSEVDFDTWVRGTAQSGNELDMDSYDELARPGTNKQPVFYALKEKNLYDRIVMKYMGPPKEHNDKATPEVMPHDMHDHSHMQHTPGMGGM